jgi:hypothetical protein
MLTALILFACSFAVVFTMGLQQLNVQGGHRTAAFVTSVLISGSSLVQFKVLPGPTGVWEIAAYLLGSAIGIVCSMAAHGPLKRAFLRLAAWRGRP